METSTCPNMIPQKDSRMSPIRCRRASVLRLNSNVIVFRLIVALAISLMAMELCGVSEATVKNRAPEGRAENDPNMKPSLSDLLSQQQKRKPTRDPASKLARHHYQWPRGLKSNKLIAPQVSQSRMNVPLPMPTMIVLPDEDEYKCAAFCVCSMIQVVDRETSENLANLTQAKCEHNKFTDILTIDRKTQIIHISLPKEDDEDSLNGIDNRDFSRNQPSFRMPRLVQFTILRELVIVNLKFQVCDSEVFKRGQKLRRLRLNHNQLVRLSKACLRHLDRLVELNLDFNLLSELESALFSSLLNLKLLSIAHNKLSDLAAHQFANLTQLVSLNLVGNSFKTINLHLFEPMQNSLRLLALARNQIKSFVHQAPLTTTSIQIQPIISYNNQTSLNVLGAPSAAHSSILQPTVARVQPFAGVVFKNLVKLNVDYNQIERIKLLQLHRFFNVKFLSIRHNNIGSIRDKAFNGLKLVELNLAHNKLQSISKCAFCNATIKRLVLADNNITMPLPNILLEPGAGTSPILSAPSAVALTRDVNLGSGQVAPTLSQPTPEQQSTLQVSTSSSSQNVLILSQSILGPLFGQLEYLDLSNNHQLANHLDLLIEPLLKLRYLNVANCGLDRSLPNPTLFKNLHQLKYLNLSHNQLDQLIAETIEPLGNLEVLDMSHNRFSELDESFLVTLDDLTALKMINLASNPWFCSQCKVSPLYDWILRSQVYNSTCIAATRIKPPYSSTINKDSDESDEEASAEDTLLDRPPQGLDDGETVDKQIPGSRGDGNYKTAVPMSGRREDYSMLIADDTMKMSTSLSADLDFDSILASSDDNQNGSLDALGAATNYQIDQLDSATQMNELTPNIQRRIKAFSSRIFLDRLATSEDDLSIAKTMASIIGLPVPMVDFCLKCEFPGELRSFSIHDLNPGDFKYCSGSAPRFTASEPKIGLTLAIVIIAALFCIIVVVIFMYRKKSHTYYTNEETDQLESGTRGKKQPVFSISSDVDQQYGDATDYSSPPMSQSFESTTESQSPTNEDEEDEEEDEDVDEEEEYDEDEELEEIDEAETAPDHRPRDRVTGDEELGKTGKIDDTSSPAELDLTSSSRISNETETKHPAIHGAHIAPPEQAQSLGKIQTSERPNHGRGGGSTPTAQSQPHPPARLHQQASNQSTNREVPPTEIGRPANVRATRAKRADSNTSAASGGHAQADRTPDQHSPLASPKQSGPTKAHKVRLKSRTNSSSNGEGPIPGRRSSIADSHDNESETNATSRATNTSRNHQSATSRSEQHRSALKAAKTIEQSTPSASRHRPMIASAKSDARGDGASNARDSRRKQPRATPEIELQMSGGSNGNESAHGRSRTPTGSGRLGRRKFAALGKGTSGVSGALVASKSSSRANTLSRRAASPEIPVEPPAETQLVDTAPHNVASRVLHGSDRRGIHHERAREWDMMSSGGSADDATSADSLAMEALNYLAASDPDEEPEHTTGGALEFVSQTDYHEGEEERAPLQRQADDRLHNFGLRPSTSTHSALTQTGSLGND